MAKRPDPRPVSPELVPNFTGVSLAEIRASVEYERAKADAERPKESKPKTRGATT